MGADMCTTALPVAPVLVRAAGCAAQHLATTATTATSRVGATGTTPTPAAAPGSTVSAMTPTTAAPTVGDLAGGAFAVPAGTSAPWPDTSPATVTDRNPNG
jgi:hypothetical protein